MRVMFENGDQSRGTRFDHDEIDGEPPHQPLINEAKPQERPQWAGVTKGRDGLLGRIETTLGSIS